MAYFFSLIRFVPNATRGEFVNIGAIAGSDDTQDWELRLVESPRRAKSIDVDGTYSQAFAFAAALEDHIDCVGQLETGGWAPGPMSIELLTALATNTNNVVQLTEPRIIAASSAAEALEIVWAHFIRDVQAQASAPRVTKHQATSKMLEAYRSEEIPEESIKKRASVVAGTRRSTFDFAIHNGSAVQLVQCWSFNVSAQDDLEREINAWSWVVERLKVAGGEIDTAEGGVPVPPNLEIAAVCLFPEDRDAATAYEAAHDSFVDNNVVELTEENSMELAHTAKQLLTH